MVGPNGLELEPVWRRERAAGEREPTGEILSPPQRAKDLLIQAHVEKIGRPEWTRTIDLFRVKEAL